MTRGACQSEPSVRIARAVWQNYQSLSYGEDGSVYIPVNVTTDAYPSFYKVDMHTATAVKGLTVEAESIKTAGKLAIKK